jgi:hypothetical protein
MILVVKQGMLLAGDQAPLGADDVVERDEAVDGVERIMPSRTTPPRYAVAPVVVHLRWSPVTLFPWAPWSQPRRKTFPLPIGAGPLANRLSGNDRGACADGPQPLIALMWLRKVRRQIASPRLSDRRTPLAGSPSQPLPQWGRARQQAKPCHFPAGIPPPLPTKSRIWCTQKNRAPAGKAPYSPHMQSRPKQPPRQLPMQANRWPVH